MSMMELAETVTAMCKPRVALSPLAPEYAPALFDLLNDWEVVRMLSVVPWPLRYEDVESFLASENPATEDFIVFADIDGDSTAPQTTSFILRCNDDAVGIASKDVPEDASGRRHACFEAPLRGAPQHEEVGRRPELKGLVPIGVCGVKKPGSDDPPRTMPRLGYWIGRRYWGRGFGTEAVAELAERAFSMYPHDRIGAGVFRENAASQRVLVKLGFTAVGTKTVESRSRDEAIEAVDMQITRAEWQAAKARRR